MFESLLSFLLASTLHLAPAQADITTQSFDDKSLLSIAEIPAQQEEYVAPASMSANAVLSVDLDSKIALYEKNSTMKLPIASLTKLMTAYIILEEEDPNTIVTISPNAASTIGSSMGLYSGEQMTIRNLLYGLLIESGNDAAVALAEFNAGSESAFVEKMNAKAASLGLYNTNYVNTTGLDSNIAYSSARDLALLSAYLVTNPTLREIVRLESVDVASVDNLTHHLTNTNILLGEYGIIGLKTGKTPAAGECLITLAVNPSGHEIITVVLGSGNRFSDTRTLIDWIYRAYLW